MFGEKLSTISSPYAGSFASAILWVESLLTGLIGNTIACVAIAMIGLSMLQGRLAVRCGLQVILGCFILFGAPYIARNLMPALTPQAIVPIAIPVPISPVTAATSPAPASSDPYAGASVPTH